MPVTMLDTVDFSKIPPLNMTVTVVASDPVGWTAGLIFNSTTNQLKYWSGSEWVEIGGATAAAGGDLTGNYPNPQIRAGVIVDADVSASANIAQSKIAGLVAALGLKVDTSRQIISGTGLSGGGTLAADRTLNVGAGTGISVGADDVSVNRAVTDTWYADRTTTENALAGLEQSQDTLMQGDLTYVGHYNPVTRLIGGLSQIGVQFSGYTVGQPLPEAAAWNAKHYFLASASSPASPDDGIWDSSGGLSTTFEVGDWIVSNGGGPVVLKDGTKAFVPYLLPENGNRWVHFSYSSRMKLASSVVVSPTINGAPGGQTVQAALESLQTKQADFQLKSQRGQANGYAPLDGNALVPTANLPPLAINEVFTVATQAAMLALTAQRGDMAIRTDNGKTYVLSSDSPGTLADWKEVMATGQVVSVNGQTGTVVVDAASLGVVPNARQVLAGNGLTGGGALSGNVTLNVVGDANLSVGADLISVLSAPKWTTARTLSLTGDVTGSASIDGSGNVSLAATVVGGTSLAKHYAGNVPAGTSVVVTHNLNSRDVAVEVYRATAPYDTVFCDVERTSTTQITLKFATAVAANAYRVVVTGR